MINFHANVAKLWIDTENCGLYTMGDKLPHIAENTGGMLVLPNSKITCNNCRPALIFCERPA